jgi:dTDP-4-dehydrorhamnose reductase
VLVVGGGGQVARALMASVPAGVAVTERSELELDITDSNAVTSVLAEGFDWLINGAAYTAVDLAEKEADKAKLVNETAVGILAHACRAAGTRLFHISTDFVFDGRSNHAYLPSDLPNPLSVYGVTKLGGERALKLDADGTGIILRTAWVYAAGGRNFVLTMLKLMRERPEVRVVCDQIGTPTWAGGIAAAIWGLIEAKAAPGIYHWTDLGVASWYDFAVAIQEEGLARGLLTQAVPVIPIPTAAYPTPAVRPAFSVLNTESTRALVPHPAQHWRTNLRRMLDEVSA